MKLIKPLLGVTALLLSPNAFASDCGPVTIADMNWQSATLLAHVDQFILEHGYGCDAELVPGDTQPTGTSMIEKGEPDIASEFWTNSMKEALDKGVEDGRLRYAGQSLSDGGIEGWYVPAYLVEANPELATIEGIKANAALFEHPEDPDKAMFMGCPAGWNCQISSENLFRAMNMEEAGFELVDPGSGAGLAGAIAKANEREEAWLGYYWEPTSVLGKYDMVKIDFGAELDMEHWGECITQAGCLEPKPAMYPSAEVMIVTTADFAERAPQAFTYLENRSIDNARMNALLAWMEDNQADGEFAAYHLLTEHEDIWTAWVPAEIADKVREEL